MARTAPAATPIKAVMAGKDEDMADDIGSRNGSSPGQGCTQAQLRRFIKSRSYIPMHELRRRFAIDGEADDVLAVETRERRYWAGLPPRECGFLAAARGPGRGRSGALP